MAPKRIKADIFFAIADVLIVITANASIQFLQYIYRIKCLKTVFVSNKAAIGSQSQMVLASMAGIKCTCIVHCGHEVQGLIKV